MQEKHLKDFTIVVGVIFLLIFTFRVYFFYKQTRSIPHQSRYQSVALDSELMKQIEQIEQSIRARKDFRFTVNRDPLKQDLIIQTRLDLLKEWEDRVRRMMRLSAVFTDTEGNNKAIIVWNGENNVVAPGDMLNNHLITKINAEQVEYEFNGRKGYLQPQPVPPKPVELQTGKNRY